MVGVHLVANVRQLCLFKKGTQKVLDNFHRVFNLPFPRKIVEKVVRLYPERLLDKADCPDPILGFKLGHSVKIR